MSLIENDQIIGLYLILLQTREHPLTRQGIDADNHQIAPGSKKRIAQPSIASRDNAKRQVEQVMHFMCPVPHQACWWHDEGTGDEPASEHLPQIEAGHNRFPCTRIVT